MQIRLIGKTHCINLHPVSSSTISKRMHTLLYEFNRLVPKCNSLSFIISHFVVVLGLPLSVCPVFGGCFFFLNTFRMSPTPSPEAPNHLFLLFCLVVNSALFIHLICYIQSRNASDKFFPTMH